MAEFHFGPLPQVARKGGEFNFFAWRNFVATARKTRKRTISLNFPLQVTRYLCNIPGGRYTLVPFRFANASLQTMHMVASFQAAEVLPRGRAWNEAMYMVVLAREARWAHARERQKWAVKIVLIIIIRVIIRSSSANEPRPVIRYV